MPMSSSPPTGPLEREHYDLIFHALAVRNTARWSPALFAKPAAARHDWQIARDLTLRILSRRADAASGSGVSGLARRAAYTAKRLPQLAALQGQLRTSPRQQVDVLLRTSRHRLSVSKLAKTPGGVDLGPLRSQFPARLQTPGKRIDIAAPLVLAALDALDAPPAAGPEELLLIGRRHQRDCNSWLHNTTRLTRGRPRHQLLINPGDAAARGIGDGDLVEVTSSAGKVTIDVRLSDDLMAGVVSLPHGYGHAAPGVQLRNATTLPGVSMNDLTDPERTEGIGANAVLNGIPVTVGRASETTAKEHA